MIGIFWVTSMAFSRDFFLQPLLHAGDPHAVLGEFDSIFTFFCMQVITMVFWTVLYFIFTFFLLLFWGELDLIFTISSLKVIIVMFWIEFDFIVHRCPLLNADVLRRVG